MDGWRYCRGSLWAFLDMAREATLQKDFQMTSVAINPHRPIGAIQD
jgi:hypothetical protein